MRYSLCFHTAYVPKLTTLTLYKGITDKQDYSARGLTISPNFGLHTALSMEKVNGKVEGFLRPITNGKEQMFIPLRAGGHDHQMGVKEEKDN